jgi:heptaprenyl diphosphate synthase
LASGPAAATGDEGWATSDSVGLKAVLDTIRCEVADEDPEIAAVLTHLLRPEASLVRPRLALAVARVCATRLCPAPGHLVGRPAAPDLYKGLTTAAASVELLHMASLYHDDLIDEAAERRGTVAVHRRWGLARTVVGGDLLVARALALAARSGRRHGEVLLDAYGALCRGQMLESVKALEWERTEAEYFVATSGKAGAMFEASARIGAVGSGCSREQEDTLGRFGLHLGIAYQVVDDLVDIRGAGGEVRGDIARGVCSLPVVLALKRNPELSVLLRSSALGSRPTLVRRAASSGVLEESARAARDHLDLARAALRDAFGPDDEDLARYVNSIDVRLPGRSRLTGSCEDKVAREAKYAEGVAHTGEPKTST